MQAPITSFWGKLGPLAATWHPLRDHSADVAACCEALLLHTLLGRRLARSGGLIDLDRVAIARLSFLAALHDLGKFNSGFQRKAAKVADPRVNVPTVGHTREFLGILGDSRAQQSLFSVLPPSTFESWSTDPYTPWQLLVASVCHHGKPYSCVQPYISTLWTKSPYGDPYQGIRQLIDAARAWFPDAFSSGSLLPGNPEFQHHFAGLVMLADWIGSDTSLFPYSENDGPRMGFARTKALVALDALGLRCDAFRSQLDAPTLAFCRVLPTGCRPRPLQQMLLEAPLPAAGVVVLEAETGSGKTEAALAWYLRLFAEGHVDGLYFALPTRTAATQLQARLTTAIQNVWPNPTTAPAVTLAVPGYLRVDDTEGTRLPGFEVLWNDEDPRRNRHRTWASEHPKRYLAGSVVVGTIDQVLLSSLKTSHAHLRATCLSRLLLVVDEVHASDVYMNRLLEEVLHEHIRNGGQALLLSATLGSTAHAKLLSTSGTPLTIPPLGAAIERPYPMATVMPYGATAPTFLPIADTGRAKAVALETSPLADEPVEIAALALGAAERGARVLLIRNTVGDCIETQLALEELAQQTGRCELLFGCHGIHAPHHSRFAPADRKVLDASLEAEFGKDNPRTSGLVICATQTVEQSLDIDADILITDLCPADVLLQRLGRLHRHQRATRPAGFDTPRALVLVPEERALWTYIDPRDGKGFGPHGYGTVYDDLRVLDATWGLVNAGSVAVPAENRSWVELATHAEALADYAEGDHANSWQPHIRYLLGLTLAHRKFAKDVLLARQEYFGDTSFPEVGDAVRRATTRLGAMDRIVLLKHPTQSPFDTLLKQLKIPGRWLKDLELADAHETDIQVISKNPCEFSFAIQGQSFIYSKYGLRQSS